MSIHLTPALEQQLEQIAAQTNRTPRDLVQEAMEQSGRHVASLAAEVREGKSPPNARAGLRTMRSSC
jgi:predicted transcriptional regulator